MKFRRFAVVLLPFVLMGCERKKEGDRALTSSQALTTLDEASFGAQAESLTASAVEISTNFTIGGAVEAAAAELRTFITSQLPCADVTLSGSTLQVIYGEKQGNCSYRGHTFSGKTSVTVSRNDSGNVVVNHTWTDFSNGRVKVSGSAEVTWDFDAKSRHVVYDSSWTRLADGRQAQGSGDVTQSALDGGLAEGIRIDGSRSWHGARGSWDLAIDGVEMRWLDPVPQAGSYALGTPYGKSVSLGFVRKDADTIHVTVSSAKATFAFDVTSRGQVAASQ